MKHGVMTHEEVLVYDVSLVDDSRRDEDEANGEGYDVQQEAK